MIHRFALLLGGTGAAGVLALALALGGFGAPLSNSPDAFVPMANDALGGGVLPADVPTDQPTMNTSRAGGAPQDGPRKVIDTVYVLPAPAGDHAGKPANDADQPADPPREPSDDNNGGNQAGDDQGDDSSAGGDDHSDDGNHSDDGGDVGDQEPGDD